MKIKGVIAVENLLAVYYCQRVDHSNTNIKGDNFVVTVLNYKQILPCTGLDCRSMMLLLIARIRNLTKEKR